MPLQDVMHSARILIVDDEPANVRLIERILERSGYSEVVAITDSREVLGLLEERRTDLILLDLHMPEVDGFALLEEISRTTPSDDYLPILVLTADVSEAARERALSTGAMDFLTKPLQATEVMLRVRNLLSTRFLHKKLLQQNENLDELVRERTRELEEARVEVLERLTQAAEFRDDATGKHTRRVGNDAAATARLLGLDQAEVELIRRAAPLHDVGKVAIPDAILLKPGRLTPDEFEVMKTHTTLGAEMLAGGRSPMMHLAQRIALCHHERWDGNGYPNGLAGEEIPLPARIVAIVDFYDALSHARPYRTAWEPERIWEEIERENGRHFDPVIVEAFSKVKLWILPVASPAAATAIG